MPNRIVIADDEKEALEILKEFFLDCGFEVTAASNGQEALDAIKKIQPRIAILDLRMPVMDGEAVIKEIPQVSPHTKVIIMTGYTDENYIKDHVLSQRVDAFLEKPIDLDTLKVTIDKLCAQ